MARKYVPRAAKTAAAIVGEEVIKHHLYRHFDADGLLLYVGISINAINRLYQHSNASAWFDEIKTITIEHFDSLDAVVNAERTAIRDEKPKWNSQAYEPRQVTNQTGDFDLEWVYDCYLTVEEIYKKHAISQQSVLKMIRDGKWRYYVNKIKKKNGPFFKVEIRVNAMDFQEYMLSKGKNYELP
jgi:hypothetical protein